MEVCQKAVSVLQVHSRLAAFQPASRECLAQAPTAPKAAVDTLLTLRFQTFKAVPVVGETPETGLAPVVKRSEAEVYLWPLKVYKEKIENERFGPLKTRLTPVAAEGASRRF